MTFILIAAYRAAVLMCFFTNASLRSRNCSGCRCQVILCLFLVLWTYLAACSSARDYLENTAAESSSKVILSVGDQEFTLAHFNLFVSSRIGEFIDHTDIDRAKSQMLEDFVEEQFLDQEGRRIGISVSPDELEIRLRALKNEHLTETVQGLSDQVLADEVRRRIRLQQFLGFHLTQNFKPTEEEIRSYYSSHTEDFRIPETVHVQEILVGTADQAERILELLNGTKKKNFSKPT